MDDLTDLLGIKQNPDEAFALKELARRANDRLRVYNPTNNDYHVAWDLAGAGGYFIVPARENDIGFGKGQNVHPRYIAFKFFREISGLMLEAEQRMRIDEENKRRKEKGMMEMDKTFQTTEELKFVTANGLMMNNQEKLKELLPKIILGIEQEWGMDALPQSPVKNQVNWQDVLAIVDRKAGDPVPQTAQPRVVQSTKQVDNTDDPLAAIV